MTRALLVPTLACALAAAACESFDANFPRSAGPTTSLRIHGTPADAVVTIDEELVGPLALVQVRGVALREGTHQVTVEAPGFFPWDKLVVADSSTAGKKIDLAVELVPIPR
jgi:hypothetical protein